ncbi:hypothetical protein SSAG_06200 [Streptomyces sp. Mg1]|nr:hypothetical protein SSAG_06200 [Streptomyces sp. Mg1]
MGGVRGAEAGGVGGREGRRLLGVDPGEPVEFGGAGGGLGGQPRVPRLGVTDLAAQQPGGVGEPGHGEGRDAEQQRAGTGEPAEGELDGRRGGCHRRRAERARGHRGDEQGEGGGAKGGGRRRHQSEPQTGAKMEEGVPAATMANYRRVADRFR